MSERKVTFDEQELRERLTALQYHVTQEAGTEQAFTGETWDNKACLLYTSPSPRDGLLSRMPSSA